MCRTAPELLSEGSAPVPKFSSSMYLPTAYTLPSLATATALHDSSPTPVEEPNAFAHWTAPEELKTATMRSELPPWNVYPGTSSGFEADTVPQTAMRLPAG